jgi:SAM-dependent methyltransferase
VLEVGVWKGGWAFTLLQNSNNISIIGLDPYPNLIDIQKRVQKEELKFTNFKLVSNWTQLPHKNFDLIHLDAEHTENAVAQDLASCMRNLKPGGILIVDDIRHPYFPGVAFSIYNFINEFKLSMLILSEFKAYLCREEDFHKIRSSFLESIIESKLLFEKHINELNPEKIAYAENPTVRGYPVLLCVHESNRWRALPSPESGMNTPTNKKTQLSFILQKFKFKRR